MNIETFAERPDLYIKTMCTDHKDQEISHGCRECFKLVCFECDHSQSGSHRQGFYLKLTTHAPVYNYLYLFSKVTNILLTKRCKQDSAARIFSVSQ